MIVKITGIRYFRAVLFLFSFFLFSVNNHDVSIYILDEAKNASCAREMLDTGNWDYPTFNYDLRTDKPPLHYFFMATAYKIFGINPFAARFFSAVFGALTVVITFSFTRKFLSLSAGFWAAVTLLASVHFQLQHHLAVPDPYLIFFTTAALFLFYSALTNNKLSHKLMVYGALGLGVLAKGPVAVLLPGLIFLVFLAVSRQLTLKTILRLKPLSGVLIVLAVTLPWFLAAHFSSDGEWTRGFFLDHNINRYSSKMEGHGGIFLLTFAYVFIGMFPFSFYIIQVIKKIRREPRNSFILFSLLSSAIIVLFFSISRTKLPNYTVIAYPFLAVLLGHFLSSIPVNYKAEKRTLIVLFFFSIIMVAAGWIASGFDPLLKPMRNYLFVLSVLPFGIGLAIYMLNRIKIEGVRWIIAATTMVTGLLFFLIIYPVTDRNNPVVLSRPLMEGKEVVYFTRFNPAYAFELKRELHEIKKDQIPAFFRRYPDGIIISSQGSVKDVQFPEGYGIIFSQQDMFEVPRTVLIGSLNQQIP